VSQALIYIDRNWIVGHRNNYIGYLNRLLVEKTEGEGGERAGCRTGLIVKMLIIQTGHGRKISFFLL